MSPFGPAALLLLVALLPVDAAAMEPASACLDAAAMAERDWMLPQDLVAAIGRTESGRLDHLTGRVSPWPWTVNANGSGSYFATRAEAVSFVRNLQASGVRLIDVGCFQVDLFYHPAAFASLEEAFDPGANANYAARFLMALHAQTGNWPSAVARYHSGLALEGEICRQKVMGRRSLIVLNKLGIPGTMTCHQVEAALEQKVDVVIPFLPRVVNQAVTLGTPAAASRGGFKTAIRDLAQEVAAVGRTSGSSGWFGRLFSRETSK